MKPRPQRFDVPGGDAVKRLVVLIPIALVLLSASVSAQTSAAKSSGDRKAEEALMQIERDIGDANIRRDKAYFERIEADEFIFTDSGGGLTTKAEDIASLDSPPGEFKLVSYVPDEMSVRIYGDAAVVTGRVTTVSKSKDKEVTSRSRFTDVFIRRKGVWQIVAGHSSRIREPQK